MQDIVKGIMKGETHVIVSGMAMEKIFREVKLTKGRVLPLIISISLRTLSLRHHLQLSISLCLLRSVGSGVGGSLVVGLAEEAVPSDSVERPIPVCS